jgi:hypothetical protein
MAAPNRLQEMADSLGISIEQMLCEAYEKHGSLPRAAIALGFAQNTIHEWNKKRGLRFHREISVRLVPVDKSGRRSA